MCVWFQLDPQTLQDRDWQRTVIDMNGVSARKAVCVRSSLKVKADSSIQSNRETAKP